MLACQRVFCPQETKVLNTAHLLMWRHAQPYMPRQFTRQTLAIQICIWSFVRRYSTPDGYTSWTLLLGLWAIMPTLFLCFLLICYPYIVTFLNVFYSCSCHFLADACLSWSLPSITEQQVFPHKLYAVLAELSLALCKYVLHTNSVFLIQQSCVMITFHC